jgi:DNA invertase Pin-like site-specific DNA recombinase
MATGIYLRVSTTSQSMRCQEPDLKTFAAAEQASGGEVIWYRDKASWKTMERPGWDRLWADVLSGRVNKIVCWRFDRLGRTARGLVVLRDELVARNVGLVSLRDGVDLSTPTGRMVFDIIANIAEYEREVSRERQQAGIEAAREEHGGKLPWATGRKKGTRITVTVEREELVKRLAAEGHKKAAIARTVGLSRKTVWQLLKKPGQAEAERPPKVAGRAGTAAERSGGSTGTVAQ